MVSRGVGEPDDQQASMLPSRAMPRRQTPPVPPPARVFRTTVEIDATVAKIRRRINDVGALRGLSRSDARVGNVQLAIIDTIREEFGEGSSQYHRHQYFKIDDGPIYMTGFRQDARSQAQFEELIPDAISRLEGLIQ